MRNAARANYMQKKQEDTVNRDSNNNMRFQYQLLIKKMQKQKKLIKMT